MEREFAEFYAIRKDAVLRTVLVATGGHCGAEDAAAEAFTRAYERWAVVRAHPNPTAWVIRTALNTHRSWWRRQRRERLGMPTPEESEHPSGERDLLSWNLREQVLNLSTRQRQAIALRILADLSAQEAASVLGIAAGTVDIHLRRALAALRTAATAPSSSPGGPQ